MKTHRIVSCLLPAVLLFAANGAAAPTRRLGLMHSVIGMDEDMDFRDAMPDFLQRLRLSAGVDLGPYVSLAGGLSWALLVSPEDRRPYTDDNWLQRSSFDDRIHQWPGAHLSLRLGVQ